jgi:hypothetical protein
VSRAISVIFIISVRRIVSAVMVVLDRVGLSASQPMSAHDPSKWYGMLSSARRKQTVGSLIDACTAC